MGNLTGARSNFPNSIDEIMELFTLPASLKPSAQRYQELIVKPSPTPSEVAEIATLTAELQQYIVDVEKWNKFGDILINMQKFFKDNTEVYILQKQTEFQNEIDKFTYKGVYNSSTQYYKNNIVEFFDGATTQLFLALQDSKGISPTNTTYWRILTLRGPQGERGADGIGLSFKGAWNSATTYSINDGVQFGGMLFASLANNNLNNTPDMSADTAYWSRVVNMTIVVRKLVGIRTVVTTTNTVNFIVGEIVSYNPTTDSLEVFANSVRLTKGLDYNISADNTSIIKIDGSWIASGAVPVVFEFVVTKNMIENNAVFADGNYIMNNTVGFNKLKSDVTQKMVHIGSAAPNSGQFLLWIDTN